MDLNQLIANAQNLPKIPKVVQELIESFNNDNANSHEIAEKLSKDQAMTAKVLRMANSSKYGGHRKVGSVNDAAVLIGFNALRTMVLASGLSSSIKSPEGFDLEKFWHKGFSVAILSKWLAQFSADVDNEVAFTAGMLHDIGGLLTHILVNEKALEIDRVVEKGADRVEMESSHLGFTYPEAGAELACRWKFPEEIVDGLRHQLQPETEDGQYHKLSGVLFLATELYTQLNEPVETIVANLPSEHIDKLMMDKVKLIDRIDEIKSIEDEVRESFN